MDETSPAGGTVPPRQMTRPDETIAAARAEDARIQRDCELGAGRLRILSERLAVPTRQARETWFAAWQCVADTAAAGDAENAAEALALAGNVLCVVLEGIAADWLAEARAWLRSARAACDGFANTTVVGLDDGGSFVDWASPEFAGVPRWLADRGEFGDWALAIDRVESLRLLPGLMQPPPFARSREVGFCLDVLALITAGASAGHFRALLEIPGGTGRMAGLTAALAVCFAPPPAGHEFRAVDLPGDAGQRETAGRLLRMADSAYGGCVHIKEFHQKHIVTPQIFSPPTDPVGAVTAENQMQFEVVLPQPVGNTASETESHQLVISKALEPSMRQADGPDGPLEFWYAGTLHRFDSGSARLHFLLRVLWPGFATSRSFDTADVASDYRTLRGDSGRGAPGLPRMAGDARQLNDWLTRTVESGKWIEASQESIRWVERPRQPENNEMPRG